MYVGTTLKMNIKMVKLKEFLKVHVNIQAENLYHTLYFSTLSQGGFLLHLNFVLLPHR
jgi:hypothetical protein